MTHEETFVSAKEMRVCAIVVTCFCFIYVLFVLTGAFSHESPFFMAWGLVLALVVPALSWLEFERRKKRLS